MNRIVCAVLVTAMSISLTASVYGQQNITFDIEIKQTAQDQLKYAETLAMDLGRARNEAERNLAVVRAAAAFEAVRNHWPKDPAAYVRSLLMESDLFERANAPENVVRLLEPLQNWIRGNPNEPALLRRLGTAYGMLGNRPAAEEVFKRALQSNVLQKHPEQGMLVHRAAAQFYSRSGRPRDAAFHYRQVMRDRRLRDDLRADAALDVLRAWLHANDKAAARSDLAEITATVKQATKAASPEVAASLERHLAFLAAKVH